MVCDEKKSLVNGVFHIKIRAFGTVFGCSKLLKCYSRKEIHQLAAGVELIDPVRVLD
jgi:hypothetical protein